MKTIEEINKEIQDLLDDYKLALTTAEENRIKGKIADLRLIAIYLSTNPREEYVKAEAEKLDKEINTLCQRFGEWQQARPFSSSYREYESQAHIPHKRAQLKRLKYILNLD